MELKYEISPENLKLLEIKKIALDKDKFGVLVFERSYKALEKLQEMLVEMEELGYQGALTRDEIVRIESARKELTRQVKRIHELDPASDGTFNKNVRDGIEDEILRSYERVIPELRPFLIFLRQEASLKNQNTKELQERQKATIEMEVKYKELIRKLEKQLLDLDKKEEELEEKKLQIEAGNVGIAAVRLAKHFDNEVLHYQKKAENWLLFRNVLYWIVVLALSGIAIYYYSSAIETIKWQHVVAKLVILSALWYGIAFASRNYNIHSHLEAVNRHRLAVALTLEDFLATTKETQADILKNAAEAMFKNVPIGFVFKTERESNGPAHEIINTILDHRSGT